MTKRIFIVLLAILGTLAVVYGADAKKSAPKDPQPPIVTLELSTKGNDISFDQGAIEVPFRAVVKLRFVNKAAKDSQIQHNVAVLKPGTLDIVIKQLQAASYQVEKMRNNPNILVMTKVLEPGSEEVIEFKPSEPGFYPYMCLMAGHGDMLNMRGVLHVK